jgi:hypothetical protein
LDAIYLQERDLIWNIVPFSSEAIPIKAWQLKTSIQKNPSGWKNRFFGSDRGPEEYSSQYTAIPPIFQISVSHGHYNEFL